MTVGEIDARVSAWLWFDDSTMPLAEKIERAVAYYEKKHGKKATRCRLNYRTAGGVEAAAKLTQIGDIKITIDNRVLTNHIWLAAEE